MDRNLLRLFCAICHVPDLAQTAGAGEPAR